MGRKPKNKKNQQGVEFTEVAEQLMIENIEPVEPVEEAKEFEPVEVGATWKIQTVDPKKTAEQFKADTGHELQMEHIRGNVYKVTIL